MNELNDASRALVERYLASLPEPERQHRHVVADYFCADQESADTCAALVAAGCKRATCSLAYWYRERGERMPELRDLLVVTNWQGEPKALVETLSVRECRYCEVGADFAALEGEGDGSLSWWQAAHRDFFSQEMASQGREFDENMLLVLETFRVVALP